MEAPEQRASRARRVLEESAYTRFIEQLDALAQGALANAYLSGENVQLIEDIRGRLLDALSTHHSRRAIAEQLGALPSERRGALLARMECCSSALESRNKATAETLVSCRDLLTDVFHECGPALSDVVRHALWNLARAVAVMGARCD